MGEHPHFRRIVHWKGGDRLNWQDIAVAVIMIVGIAALGVMVYRSG